MNYTKEKMQNTISTFNLDVGYDKKTVVSKVDIEALKGQMICLLGPNGAGKSTILRTLAGLISPLKGYVEINGKKLKSLKHSETAQQLAVVLTDSVEPYLMTVYELIAMGRTPYTNFFGRLTSKDHKIIEASLQDVGAEHLRNCFFNQLSDGEKQKVMIARALVQEPKLIILDEPTSHLDIRHKIEVLKILRRLVCEQKITVILSLHDIDLAMKSCQIILLINDGKVVAQGCPEDIIQNGSIDRLYNVEGAGYNELLGAVEIEGNKKTVDVFVIAGNATGIKFYRSFSRESIGMATGVIHENDVDRQVAEIVCTKTIVQAAFSDIDEDTVDEALEIMKTCEVVIDAGFPIAHFNRRNLDIIKKAILLKKVIFSLRTEQEAKEIYDSNDYMYCCGTVSEIVRKTYNTLNHRVEN